MALFSRKRPETSLRELRTEAEGLARTVDYLQERMSELELPLEDSEWMRVGDQYDREFSRDGLKRIIAMSRLMALKNPILNRAVTLQAMYVFGQGMSINSRDEMLSETVQAFLDDPDNQAELTTHQQRTMKEIELQVTGNLFFVFFTSPDGRTKVRTIDVEEIQEIICDPEDRKRPWLYKRVWTVGKETRTVYYRDWRVPKDANLPDLSLAAEPVYHVKVGGYSSMRFGVPETYAAIDWARAYKEFLEDWSTLVRSLSRFAWKMTTKGGARGVAATKTKLQTTLGSDVETNPSPVTGSVWIGSEGNDLTPMPKTGATVSADDGRRLLLMVAAATGLPETFFGDASVGSLATAKSLDRPTELKFLDRQTLWKDIFTNILNYVIDAAKGAPGVEILGEDRTLDIEFPPMLAHDLGEAVNAVVSAVTLNGKPSAQLFDQRTIIRWLATALGEDDIDELLDGTPEDEPFGEPETEA